VGNFKEVSMGTGSLFVNGVDVGFLSGAVKYVYNYDIEKFKSGIPKMLRGQQAKEIVASLQAPFAQISAENMAIALGLMSSDIVINSGAATTVTAQSRTFSAGYLGLALQSVVLDGPNISTGVDAPVVKSSDNVTTYTEGVDYLVEYGLGLILRIPTGAIASGATIKVTYKHTPPASKQINLGAKFSLAQLPIHFEHTRPNTGKKVITHMWLGSADGKCEFNFEEDKWIVNNVTFDAVFDESHPNNPLGYWLEEAA